MEESNGENLVTDTTEIHFNELYLCGVMEDHKRAKLQELANWKSQQVYVEEDRGQRCLSVRWVLTPKMIDSVVSTKARLCACGFEENQDFRTDSPTCSRIGIRFALTVISSFSWRLNSIDVKTAFLQGKEMERTVYLRPPKEAETNKIWRLKKCVYGLADASRYWYLRVKDVLINLGATICSVDQGMFLWFLCDDNNKCCPLSWNSSRIRRVVRSTIGAETLSLIEGCDTALYISEMVSEISKRMNTKAPSPVNIEALTDNQSLFDTIHSTKQTSEKRLIVDISLTAEMSTIKRFSEVCLVEWIVSKFGGLRSVFMGWLMQVDIGICV